jgi:multiple sugar transport system permease protein
LSSVFRRRRLAQVVLILLITMFVVVYLVPVYWIVVTSFKPEGRALSWPPELIPRKISLENYRTAFEYKSVFWYMRNSLIISTCSVTISMVVGCMAAYSFAKFRWGKKSKQNLLLWIMGLRIMPPIAVAIPIYLIFIRLKLIDTFAGMIIAYVFISLPFVIWLSYGFFKELPNEIIEAANIDGCGFLRLMARIVVPLAKPGLITVFLLTFMMAWNEFLFAIKLSAFRVRTLPVLISGFIIDRGLLWGQLCAVAAITVIPVILISIFIQRYIVAGLTMGAIKE